MDRRPANRPGSLNAARRERSLDHLADRPESTSWSSAAA